MRAPLLAAKSYQRTSYLPGEISQLDWWHTGLMIPVGKGATRQAMGLVTTLPHSAAHATVFTFGRTTADFLVAALGCFERLGGVPEKAVTDNEGCIVKPRRGGSPRLWMTGRALWPTPHSTDRAATAFSRGQGSRRAHRGLFGNLLRAAAPLRLTRRPATPARRVGEHHRLSPFSPRVGARVQDAYNVERTFLRPLPTPRPDVDWKVKPGNEGRLRRPWAGTTRCLRATRVVESRCA